MSLCDNCTGNNEVMKWVALSTHAKEPVRSTELSAGLDLFSAYDVTIPGKGRAAVKTDICIQIPANCYGKLESRSGLALKKCLDVGAGVIDADYTGNIAVLLINSNSEDYHIKRGDRVAQLICIRISYPKLQKVDEIAATARGERGFGSKSLHKLEKRMKI